MQRHIWRLPPAAALVLLVGFLAVPPDAQAATFTVDSTGDGPDALTADAVCADAGGACTLRAAIEQANFLPGPDIINFSITGAGPHTIQPATPLPEITEALTLNGYSEPGSSPNTNPLSGGSNAVLLIEINGSNAGAGADGFRITGGPSHIRGLAINRFTANGISISDTGVLASTVEGNLIGTNVSGASALGNGQAGVLIGDSTSGNAIGATTPAARNVISGNATGIRTSGANAVNTTIRGNYIGTNAAGNAALPNSTDGINLFGGLQTQIGGTATSAGNLLSGNGSHGVRILLNVIGTSIQGNFIGVAADGTTPLGNGGDGVSQFASNQQFATEIGGTAAGAGNVIAFNGDDGVGGLTSGSGAPANIRRNSIFSNAGLGIDVNGPNEPVLTSVSSGGGSTTVMGAYSGVANTEHNLEFFSSAVCDPSGAGEGESFVGSLSLTTDGSGNAAFSQSFPVATAAGRSVTGTATEGTQTSKFSECRAVPGPANDDDADGVRDDAESNCGGDPTNPNIRPERVDGIFAGVSDDGDPDIDEALPPASSAFDCDGDGYRGASEDHVYSYLGQLNGDQKTCQEYDTMFPNSAPHIKPSKRWPSDLAGVTAFSLNKLNIQDLSSFTNPIRYLNQDVGTDPGDARFDLVPGSTVGTDINIADLAAITASNPTGYPAMLGGSTKAFNGPVCPYAP